MLPAIDRRANVRSRSIKQKVMRVVAVISLFLGFLGLTLLDGQTFTHAVMGIAFGLVAIGCGVASARKHLSNATNRWEGRVLAALGLLLVIVCAVQLPTAYRFQHKFNEVGRER